jgi:phosphoserine aminotransferase
MKKHNFYAGPSILSEYTIKNTAAAVENFANMGLSLLEISHRSKEFVAVNDEARALIKELLDVPAGYEVVFVGGGASMQFCMVPYNLLNKKASYLDTGTWSAKAVKEAKLFGEVEVVASSKDQNYTYIPKDYTIADDAEYFHVTTNNTIYGTQLHGDLDVKQRLVADMSSDIFSRPIDVSKYDIIYAGAQKNLAPAGVTLAIVRVDALGHVDRPIPTMLNYKTHIDKDSMFNTPPVLPIYSALQTLKWYKEQGGIAAMEKKDKESYHETMYYPVMYGNDRNEDWMRGRMYYDGNSGSSSSSNGTGTRHYSEREIGPTMRDQREGRSPMSRKNYIESKEMHKDKTTQIQELDKYAQELTSDLVEMVEGASPEEKQYLSNKIAALAAKIK